MTAVISAVIRFRERAVLHGEKWGDGSTPYHPKDILFLSGQLRWKIELFYACVIEQVSPTVCIVGI